MFTGASWVVGLVLGGGGGGLVAKLCLSCDPVDCSLVDSSVHAILQARMQEWVAISFSRGSPDLGIEPRSPALQILY